MNSPRKLVLDSWAVLALLQDEAPAADAVAGLIRQAEAGTLALHMSWINLGEAYYALRRRRGEDMAEAMVKMVARLPVRLHEADSAAVLHAARIKSEQRISYADAFAVGLAASLGGAVVTGDPEIVALAGVVAVERLERERT